MLAHTIFVIIALTIRYMPLKNAIVYSTLAYVYVGIGYLIDVLKIKDKVVGFINRSGSFMGKYSYPLYITHYTVLFVFSILIHNVTVYVLVSLPIILLITYVLENLYQPAITRYFTKNKQTAAINSTNDVYTNVSSAPLSVNPPVATH